MTSQRASTPSSLSRGIIRVRISATPPPTAVELMFWMDLPRRRLASRKRSSTADWPTIGAYSSIFVIPFRKYEDALAKSFQRVAVRIQPCYLLGKFRLSKGREPAGKIVCIALESESRIEHVIVDRIHADCREDRAKLLQGVRGVICRKHE